jgi:hypothetical protein
MVKSTMATPTNNPIKPTELLEGPTVIKRRKLYDNADALLVSTKIKPRPMNPEFNTLYYGDSEPSSTATDTPAAASAAAPAATVESEEKNETNSEEKSAPPLPKTASSENISVPTDAPATASAAAPAVQSDETNKSDREVKLAPTPSMDETASSEDISAPANAPTTAPAAAAAAPAAPAVRPQPVEVDPNCGHQPSARWPNEVIAIIDSCTTYSRYDDNMWQHWNPSAPSVVGEEVNLAESKWLDHFEKENYRKQKKATPTTAPPPPSPIMVPTPAVTPSPLQPEKKMSIAIPSIMRRHHLYNPKRKCQFQSHLKHQHLLWCRHLL